MGIESTDMSMRTAFKRREVTKTHAIDVTSEFMSNIVAILRNEEWVKEFERYVEIGTPCIILLGDVSEWEELLAYILYEKMEASLLKVSEPQPGLVISTRVEVPGIPPHRKGYGASFVTKREVYLVPDASMLIDPHTRMPKMMFYNILSHTSGSGQVRVLIGATSLGEIPLVLLKKCVVVQIEPPSFESLSKIAKMFGIPVDEVRLLMGLPLPHVISYISSKLRGRHVEPVEYRKAVFKSIAEYANIITSPRLSWDDLADMRTIKKELEMSIISIFENPDEAEVSRMNPPNVLLMGPPGTGKTAIAEAILSRIPNATLISFEVSKILSMWYGESEKRLCNVLYLAKSLASGGYRTPVILFIDEIDTVLRSRWESGGVKSGGVEQNIMNILLRFLEDDVARIPSLIVIGATNRPSKLDIALLSRFPLRLPVLTPKSPEIRREIILKQIEIQTRGTKFNIDWRSVGDAVLEIARRAEFYAPREFREIVSRAKVLAYMKRKVRGALVLKGEDLLEAFAEVKPPIPPSDIEMEETVAKSYATVRVPEYE